MKIYEFLWIILQNTLFLVYVLEKVLKLICRCSNKITFNTSPKGNIDQLSTTAVLAIHHQSKLFARVKKDDDSGGDSASEDSYLNADLGELSLTLTFLI